MKTLFTSKNKAVNSLIDIYFSYNNAFLNIWLEDGKIKIDDYSEDIYFNSEDELIDFLEFEITETIHSLIG